MFSEFVCSHWKLKAYLLARGNTFTSVLAFFEAHWTNILDEQLCIIIKFVCCKSECFLFNRTFTSLSLSNISLQGVADALAKHGEEADYKGVKVHFRMDESGILHLEQVRNINKNVIWNHPIPSRWCGAKE